MKLHVSTLALLAALLPLATVRADDAKTKSHQLLVIPSEVRAQRPRGATTVYFDKLPIGTGGKPVLIHIWTAARQTPNDNYKFMGTCYVDAFNKGGGKAAKWHRVARSMYQGDGYPTHVSTRWLYPAKKQGPVLYIVSSVYMHTDCLLITYPKGIGKAKTTPSYVQDLTKSGGWVRSENYQGYGFGVDKRGMMTVAVENMVGGKYKGDGTPVKTILAWNGRQYVAPPKK